MSSNSEDCDHKRLQRALDALADDLDAIERRPHFLLRACHEGADRSGGIENFVDRFAFVVEKARRDPGKPQVPGALADGCRGDVPRTTEDLALWAAHRAQQIFFVHARGYRIDASLMCQSASEAVAKAKTFGGDVAISITDPASAVWVPRQFDDLLVVWPDREARA